MVEATCHCGAVTITVETAPTTLTSCNCSVCRRSGGLWCYYTPAASVHVTGATVPYIWGDKSIAIHHCPTCGNLTHWSPLDPKIDRMGVNARLMDPAIVAAAKIRRFDGADTWKYLDE